MHATVCEANVRHSFEYPLVMRCGGRQVVREVQEQPQTTKTSVVDV